MEHNQSKCNQNREESNNGNNLCSSQASKEDDWYQHHSVSNSYKILKLAASEPSDSLAEDLICLTSKIHVEDCNKHEAAQYSE